MIAERLAQHRSAIIKLWRDDMLGCYPEEGRVQFEKDADPFANPIGVAIRETSGPLFDFLAGGSESGDVNAFLDRLLRPRAIQQLEPSEAVGFIFRLKDIVRTVLADRGGIDQNGEFYEFSRRVDRLGLIAFDVFMKCREDLFSIRLNEVRNRSLKAFERLNEWQTRKYGADLGGRD